MPSINPYLNFAGNTEEAFNFYKSVFGGEFFMVQRYSNTPDSDKLPPGLKDKIMHISLPIGNNFYICVNPDSKEEADKWFNALAEGGKVNMPIQDMFWGAYWGDLTDKFGIQWMINYDKK